LANDRVRDQRLGRQPALDQPRRGRRLHDRASTAPAGILGTARHQHAELRRHDVEPLGDVLADLVHEAGAARARGVDVDRRLDPLQVRGQRSAVGPAPRRPARRRRLLLFRALGRGGALLHVLEPERHWVGIELLRAPTELVALERLDHGLVAMELVGDAGELGALGHQQRLQGFDVVRQSGVARHAVRCSALVARLQDAASP